MPERFIVIAEDYQPTCTGILITAFTDALCHLTCRITREKPLIHFDPKAKRGVALRTMPRFCFVQFWDVQQQEPGDTLIHSFIIEPWPIGELRYHYYFGTVAGQPSPSESPVIDYDCKKHICTSLFYPDAHPELHSVDGYAYRFFANENWEDCHDGPGTNSYDLPPVMRCEIQTATVFPFYMGILRSLILFTTLSLPPQANVLSAFIKLTKSDYYDFLLIEPSCAIYTASPADNISVNPIDYQCIGAPRCSNILSWSEMLASNPVIFTLNSYGLARIIKGGITKFGIREAKYDVPNEEPLWRRADKSGWSFYTAEQGGVYRPTLSVTYELT